MPTVGVVPTVAGLGYAFSGGNPTVDLTFLLLGDPALGHDPWTVYQPDVGNSPGLFSQLQYEGWEIAAGGGYAGGSVDIGAGTVNFDPVTNTIEYGLPTGPTWTSADTYTVSFRYIAIGGYTADSSIMGFIDPGETIDLAGEPLAITAPESALFPGTYPIVSFVAGT